MSGVKTVVRALMVVGIIATTSMMATSPASAEGPIVTGGGSSFIGLLVSQWRADVSKPPYNLSINYTPSGSGFGRDKYLSGLLDFGQSDIEFQPEEQDQLRGSGRSSFVYVPVGAGALAFMFNVTGTDGRRVTNLKLTANDVCRLFTVPDIKWSDPAIVASNPGIPLPDKPVRPVVRADKSGTTYVFSEFCINRAKAVWDQFISIGRNLSGADLAFGAGQATSSWPQGYGAVGAASFSDGVANAVGNNSTGQNTITYIETGYTKVKGLPAALVQNPAGAFTPPNPVNSTVALAYATGRPNGTFQLSYNGGDPRAYFPSTYSYAIAQTTGFSADKGKVLATYLNYAACEGQKRAEPLSYSRLSVQLVDIALNAITQIPGAPPRPATASCGASALPTVSNAPAKAAGPAAAAGGAKAGAGPAAAGGAAADQAAAEAAAAEAAAAAAAAETAAVDPAAEELAADEAAAAGAATGSSAAATASRGDAGPENNDVLFTFLLGAGLVALGSFVAKGTKSSWGQ